MKQLFSNKRHMLMFILPTCMFFQACQKESIEKPFCDLPPSSTDVVNQSSSTMSVTQNEMVLQQGSLTAMVTYLGETIDNSDPSNPQSKRKVSVQIARPKNFRPTWKYNTSTPRWSVVAAIMMGYEVENIDQPSSTMSVTQNEVVLQEGSLTAKVTYLGEIIDNSDPSNPQSKRKVSVQIARPTMFTLPTWKYISATPYWAVKTASAAGYEVECLDCNL